MKGRLRVSSNKTTFYIAIWAVLLVGTALLSSAVYSGVLGVYWICDSLAGLTENKFQVSEESGKCAFAYTLACLLALGGATKIFEWISKSWLVGRIAFYAELGVGILLVGFQGALWMCLTFGYIICGLLHSDSRLGMNLLGNGLIFGLVTLITLSLVGVGVNRVATGQWKLPF